MYAIVEIAGKQFKVQENSKLYVPKLKADVDGTVTLDRVLLVSGDGDIHIGAPTVTDANITAKVLRHVKGDKVLVFKKKRRKRYRVKRGHRQQYTQIRIDTLSLNSGKKGKKKTETEA
jgi:large subunit ribosomal protein L21